jgi:inhibitor of KinA sporulation pathway (predicted exonuclease)
MSNNIKMKTSYLFLFFITFLCFSTVYSSYNTSEEYIIIYRFVRPDNQTLKCQFCETVVEIMDYGVKEANETLHGLETFVDALCKVINPIVEPTCKTILNDIQEIFNWITKNNLSPQVVCQKLGFCQA